MPNHPDRTVRWAIGDLNSTRDHGIYDTPSLTSAENAKRIHFLFENGLYDLPNARRPACHKDGNHSYVSMYGRLRWTLPAQTITTGFGSMGQGRFVHPGRRRTLTPHEAARLQTFPDWFQFGTQHTTWDPRYGHWERCSSAPDGGTGKTGDSSHRFIGRIPNPTAEARLIPLRTWPQRRLASVHGVREPRQQPQEHRLQHARRHRPPSFEGGCSRPLNEIPRPSFGFGVFSMQTVFDTPWTRSRCAFRRAVRTSCFAGPRSRCSSTAASGTGAQSTQHGQRRTPSSGRKKSTPIAVGTRTRMHGCQRPGGW